jgi:hypothetical protein
MKAQHTREMAMCSAVILFNTGTNPILRSAEGWWFCGLGDSVKSGDESSVFPASQDGKYNRCYYQSLAPALNGGFEDNRKIAPVRNAVSVPWQDAEMTLTRPRFQQQVFSGLSRVQFQVYGLTRSLKTQLELRACFGKFNISGIHYTEVVNRSPAAVVHCA